jgi:SAM-dependent methyltransferase
MSDPRARMRELAAEYVRKGDQLSWFERLYQEGERGEAIVPWGDGTPNPHLVEFWQQHPLETGGKTALVIGSGFGDDAEQLAKWGFRTTGLDIAPSAIEQTKKRYPHSPVNYVLADLFDPPRAWIGAFDFVLEIYTIQSFAGDLRTKSIDAIARFVAPRGHLLVIARGRDESEPEVPGPPWPLTREELDRFQRAGLEVESFEDYAEHEPPWVRRFRVLYHRLNLSSRSRRDAIGGLNKSSLFIRFTSCSLGAPLDHRGRQGRL